jgi:hypothetical protein
MSIKQLRKDRHRAVRINNMVLEALERHGYTLQSFLDESLDRMVKIGINTNNLANHKYLKELDSEDANNLKIILDGVSNE